MFEIKFDSESFDELSRKVASIVFEKVKYLIETPQKEEKYLTSKEVSNALHISTVTLNDYCKQGLIPSYRIGSSVRFRLSDIDKAISNGFRKYTAKVGGKL